MGATASLPSINSLPFPFSEFFQYYEIRGLRPTYYDDGWGRTQSSGNQDVFILNNGTWGAIDKLPKAAKNPRLEGWGYY